MFAPDVSGPYTTQTRLEIYLLYMYILYIYVALVYSVYTMYDEMRAAINFNL